MDRGEAGAGPGRRESGTCCADLPCGGIADGAAGKTAGEGALRAGKEFSMKQKKPCKDKRPAPQEMTRFAAPETDPQGSWTGHPADPREKPVQDADDL